MQATHTYPVPQAEILLFGWLQVNSWTGSTDAFKTYHFSMWICYAVIRSFVFCIPDSGVTACRRKDGGELPCPRNSLGS